MNLTKAATCSLLIASLFVIGLVAIRLDWLQSLYGWGYADGVATPRPGLSSHVVIRPTTPSPSSSSRPLGDRGVPPRSEAPLSCPIPANNYTFKCLEDDSALWEIRRLGVMRDIERACPYSSSNISKTVPIVITVEALRPETVENAMSLLRVTANYAAKFNDQVHVILFGPDLSEFRKNRHLFAHPVTLHLIEDESDPLYVAHRALDQVYVHQSVNSLEYELSCMRRWFTVRAFAERYDMDYVFPIDYDTLLFTNVTHEMVMGCYEGCRAGGVSEVGTYVSFWSREEAGRLAESIRRFYRDKEYLNDKVYGNQISDMITMEYHFNTALPREHNLRCLDERRYSTKGMWNTTDRLFDWSLMREGNGQFHQDALGMPFFVGRRTGEDCFLAKSLHFQGTGKSLMRDCTINT